MTTERTNAVTMKGNSLTLIGKELKVGERAPNFTAIDQNLAPYHFAPEKGRIYVISVVPSLDTPVCDQQTRYFNEQASKNTQVQILTISMDLPFAQKRWCGMTDSNSIQCLSDYRDREFGKTYGTYIKELGLDTRAVFLIDQDGIIQYVEYVKEVTDSPNFEALQQQLKRLIQ